MNSSKKILVEQYSLGRVNQPTNNLNSINTKKGSHNILISFRGTKKQDINVSVSRKKIKT
jgi:hypothetical protein